MASLRLLCTLDSTDDIFRYLIIGTDKVKKQVNQDLFHLSEEDVQAFCKDEALKKALVPTDNLYITGELGEGEQLLSTSSLTRTHLKPVASHCSSYS